MEIERKYLAASLPENLNSYEHHALTQAYLNRMPVVRVRMADDKYELTYKGSGMLAREEYNLPLDSESFQHLLKKADGKIIEKTRYKIPYGKYTIELDVFFGMKKGLIMAEVEFPSLEEAESFVKPDWFGREVTFDPAYHNSNMAYGE